jgi:glycosyltransferase involved in cell wall biosynthesis
VRIALDGFPLLTRRAGVGQYTRCLADALARVGASHSFVLVCPRPVRLLPFYDLPAFAAPNLTVAAHGWISSLQYTVGRRLGRQASVEALIGRFDLYHATNGTFPTPIERATRVVTIHDMTLFLFPEWHPRKRVVAMANAMERATVEADHIVTPSLVTTKDVTRLLGVDPARITTIPYAADAAFGPLERPAVEAALSALGLRYGEYLLYLGTIEPRKNLGRLLDALRAVPSVGPLVVAGAPGWDADAQRRLAHPEIAARVRQLGYVPDSSRPFLMNGARGFVYPSLYEGFGLPVLEALACGTPVLTSDRGSLPEVVAGAALMVDPYDVDALAGGLQRLWTDTELGRHLGEAGRRRAAEFSWETTARMTLALYDRVTQR